MRDQTIIKVMLLILLLLVGSIIYPYGNTEREDWINDLDVAKYTNQIIVVAVSEGNTELSFYEKNDKGEWLEILKVPAIIGENGIGKTKEGDGKTPIGLYHFIKAFGILGDPGTTLEYVQVNESHYWVDDMSSKYYNQFISTGEVEMDWSSAEHICEYGKVYNYVLATSYNEDCTPGVGSAVFLHCLGQAKYTAGCVAVEESYMKKIIKRVEPQCILIIDTVDNISNY